VAALRLYPIVRLPRPFIKELIAKCCSYTPTKLFPNPPHHIPRHVLDRFQRRPLLTQRAQRRPLLLDELNAKSSHPAHYPQSKCLHSPNQQQKYRLVSQAVFPAQQRPLAFPSRPRKLFSSPKQAQKNVCRGEKTDKASNCTASCLTTSLAFSLTAYEGSVGFLIMITWVRLA
jgi:hypothetical protein